MLVARDSVADYFWNAAQDGRRRFPSILRYITHRCTELESRDRLLPVMHDLFKKAWELDPAKGLAHFSPPVVDLFEHIVLTGDWEFFDLAAGHSGGAIPLSFFPWARTKVVEERVRLQDLEKG